MSFIISKTSGFLIKIPSLAPFATELTIAIGVARPRAQGQEIISTEILASIALKVSPTKKYHKIKVARAIRITIGTNTLATLSANLAIGICLLCALANNSIIFESWVSVERFKTSTFNVPCILIVPAIISSPSSLYTAKDSPVIIEASIWAFPSIISASVDIFSPCFIKTLSLICKSFAAISLILPSSCIKLAFTGLKSIRFFKKSLARARERSSNKRPNNTKVIITLAPSK